MSVTCTQCGKRFAAFYSLQQHVKDTHSRKSFRDIKRPGIAPQLMKRIPGESHVSRHLRRKNLAMETAFAFRAWCESHGLTLTVTNSGHHWCVRFPNDSPNYPRYQWWPSTAKCVYQSRWRHGIHVHDISQLAHLIAEQEGFER